MRFGLQALAVAGFEFESPLESGPMKVALGPSEGVSGYIEIRDGTTVIDAASQAYLTLSSVRWPLANGSFEVTSAVRLANPRVDFRIGGDKTEGEASVASASAERLRILAAGQPPIEIDGLRLDQLFVRVTLGTTRLTAQQIAATTAVVPTPSGTIHLGDVRIAGLEWTATRSGGWIATIASLEAKTLSGGLNGTDIAAMDIALTDVRLSSSGRMAVGHCQLRNVNGRIAKLASLGTPSASEPTPRRTLPLDTALLELLSGHMNADVVTEVRLPIIKSRRANHPLRLKVKSGMIRYKELEHSIASLEDAVLDFNLTEGKLCLDKDVPLIPFDRSTLVSWSLPQDEQALADDGWVKLGRLAAPTIEIESKPEGTDEGARFVEEISATNIDVALSVAGHPGRKLTSGARLRLGVTSDSAPLAAVDRLTVTGNITYRPDRVDDPGVLDIAADRIRCGVEDWSIASITLAGRAHAQSAMAKVRFADVTPTCLDLSIETLELFEVSLSTGSDGEVEAPDKGAAEKVEGDD